MKISLQKINLSEGKLTQTRPFIFLASDKSLDFKYLFWCLCEVRDTSWLLIGCVTVLCLCVQCMFVSVARINACERLCPLAALFLSVKPRGAHTHTHTDKPNVSCQGN